MTHSYETWLLHIRRGSFIWDMTHSCATCDITHMPYWYETWLVLQDITRSYTIWLIDMHMRPNTRDLLIWDMTHSNETWLIRMRHDSFIWNMTHSNETWLIRMRHGLSVYDTNNWYADAIWLPWLVSHTYQVWLTHMRHDSLMCTCDMTCVTSGCETGCETRLVHMTHDLFIYDLTHWHAHATWLAWLIDVRYDSFKSDMANSHETWPIHMKRYWLVWDLTDSYRDMTHSYKTWLIHVHIQHGKTAP